MAKKEKKRTLPLWSKAIISMTVLSMCMVMVSIVAVMKSTKDMVDQAQNPVYIEQVAQSIAAFPQPLPKGYKYFCALDFVGLLKVLAIDYEEGKRQQQLMFISYAIDNQDPGEHIDASKLVKEIYNHGLNTVRTHSKFANLQTEGCWTIQGFMIPYMIGGLADVKGTGLVACLVNELQKKVVLFYAAQLDAPEPTGAADKPANGTATAIANKPAEGVDKPADGTATVTGDKPAGADKPADGTSTAIATADKPTSGTASAIVDKPATQEGVEPFDMHIVTNLLQDVKGF